MRKKSAGAIWGILMILGGILLAGRILNWFEFNLFFRGWWTLFLIIPSAVDFLTGQRNRSASLKGLIIGVLLLMAAQGFIEYRMFFPLVVAAFLILSGCRMMFSGEKTKSGKREAYRKRHVKDSKDRMENGWKNAAENMKYEDASRYSYEEEYDYYAEEEPAGGFGWNEYANREEYRRENYEQGRHENFAGNGGRDIYGNRSCRNGRCACTSVFMGKEIDFSGEVFDGAVLSSVMGAIDLNLSGAILYHDVTVEAIAVLGGIDIIAPQNARVIVQGKPVLGSVDYHAKRNGPPPAADAPVVLVKATCIMGGIDIYGQ